MKRSVISLSIFLFALIGCSSSLFAENDSAVETVKAETSSFQIPDKERWSEVDMKASVEAINYETRKVLLRGEKGNLRTIEVDESIKNLKDVRIGDTVQAKFKSWMKAEFRAPTEAELANPFNSFSNNSGSHSMPIQAVKEKVTKAIVTVEIINNIDQLVTIKGPKGEFKTLEVKDKEVLQKLHAGQYVIIHHSEALAVIVKHEE